MTTKQDKAEARDYLAPLFDNEKPTAYTILRYVSKSGMSRDISVMVKDKDGDLVNISYYVGQLLGYRVTDAMGARAVRVSGCGMDMGFHIVYNLSAVLFSGRERSGYVIRHQWV